MVNYNYLFYFLLITGLGLFSCEENTIPDTPRGISEKKSLLTNTVWRYQLVFIDNEIFTYSQADQTMEPFCGAVRAIRDLVFKRRINYTDDNSYQLLWENRGEYNLGTEGDENWQPRFGGYKFIEEENILIHNPNLPTETIYQIELSEDQLIRTSLRTMSKGSPNCCGLYPDYNAGDEVLFIEKFVPVDQPRGSNGVWMRENFTCFSPIPFQKIDEHNYKLDNYLIHEGTRFLLSDTQDFTNCTWGRFEGNERLTSLTGRLERWCNSDPDTLIVRTTIYTGNNGLYTIHFNDLTYEFNFELIEENNQGDYYLKGDFNGWGNNVADFGKMTNIGNNIWELKNQRLVLNDQFKIFPFVDFGVGCEFGINSGSRDIYPAGILDKQCFGAAGNAQFKGATGIYTIQFNNQTNEIRFIL